LYAIGLPVTLLSFTGSKQGDYNELKWVTGFEENALQFELERSSDGTNFQKIATIPATNSPLGSIYSYRDNNTSLINKRNISYRLRMVDVDGQFSYSNVVNIRMNGRSDIIITGNPFEDELRIVFNSGQTQKIQINLYDGSGKKVAGKPFAATDGLNNIQLENLQYLARGTYLLEVLTTFERFSRKVVKQ
jgi:hypothetical protein